MLKQNPLSADDANIISYFPLGLSQLQMVADEIIDMMNAYRPEYRGIIHLQRCAGTRVNELFQPERWKVQSSSVVHLKPQKGNALRILNFSDIGFTDAEAFSVVLADMQRLSKRQYERAFAQCVSSIGLWRLYENGYLRPSTHMLRHLRIKELAAIGTDMAAIGTWIGEKNLDNLNYYLNSLYFQ